MILKVVSPLACGVMVAITNKTAIQVKLSRRECSSCASTEGGGMMDPFCLVIAMVVGMR